MVIDSTGIPPWIYDDTDNHLNHVTGVASSAWLGVPLLQRQLESSLARYAPRYTRSGWALFLKILGIVL